MPHHINYPSPKSFTEHPDTLLRKAKQEAKEARKKLKTKNAIRVWGMFCEGKTLRQIGKKVGLTGERVRQILKRYYPDEYDSQSIANVNTRHITRLGIRAQKKSNCTHCGKEFSNPYDKKFCSKECHRLSMYKNVYPEWVGGRSIVRENFTKAEWTKINSLRTALYYHRNRDRQKEKARLYQRKNKDRHYIYQKRCFERKVYGYAITPLPGGSKNKAATKK